MKRCLIGVLAVALTAALLGTVPARADDLNAPPWRGLGNFTQQEWDFRTGDETPDTAMDYLPDGDEVPCINLYGGALARYTPGPGQHWYDILDGRQGVLALSGELALDIYNHPVMLKLKEMRVQITWQPQEPGAVPSVDFDFFGPGSDPFDGGVPAETTMPLEGDWWHTTLDIEVRPNPSFETILIGGLINVDQVVVDTRCIPEPSVLALLSLGFLTLVVRRRRR